MCVSPFSLCLRQELLFSFKAVRTHLPEGLTGHVRGKRACFQDFSEREAGPHLIHFCGRFPRPAPWQLRTPPSLPTLCPISPGTRCHTPRLPGEVAPHFRIWEQMTCQGSGKQLPVSSRAVLQTLGFMARYSQGSAFLDVVNLPSSCRSN